MPAQFAAWDGWQGQFRRMRRWADRFEKVVNRWYDDDSLGDIARYALDEQVDYLLAFCVNAHHLGDYLVSESALSREQLRDVFSSSSAIQVTRDLTNVSKHSSLRRPPAVDSKPLVLRTWQPHRHPKARLTIGAGAHTYDAADFVLEVGDTWRAALEGHGLNPDGISEPRQALIDALNDQESNFS